MATFTGTTQKCKACEKTVYLVDELTADSRVYHRACFRCHHCKSTLKLHNYSSFEGVLYCKPHFDQLFKMTGSLDKSFEGAPRITRAERSSDYQSQANSKVSSLFGGTQEKCVSCKKTVYPIEKVAVDGTAYHKSCFRCTHGGCVISPSNYVAHEQRLYCRHHHSQLFKQKGNFSKLDSHHHQVHEANGISANGSTTGAANGTSAKGNTADGAANGRSTNGSTTDGAANGNNSEGVNDNADEANADVNEANGGVTENTVVVAD